jgi:large subunit ribosomal protein L28
LANKCGICGKGPQFGHQISHAHNVSKRRWNPNLQRIRVKTKKGTKTMRVCTRCIKGGRILKAIA